jgi:hypothetical protein
MDNFFRTRMGMTFFEGTLPSLVRELKRLNDNLEADRKERATHVPVKEHANGHSEYMCPGCGCEPGDGRTDGCTHPDGWRR